MSKQPEALRLADALENGTCLSYIERDNTATELRRLHDVNHDLLETLKDIARYTTASDPISEVAHAAIAKAEGSV